jgi:hypothetical protein
VLTAARTNITSNKRPKTRKSGRVANKEGSFGVGSRAVENELSIEAVEVELGSR